MESFLTITINGDKYMSWARERLKELNRDDSNLFKYVIGKTSFYSDILLQTNSRYEVKVFLDANGLSFGKRHSEDSFREFNKCSWCTYLLEKRI